MYRFYSQWDEDGFLDIMSSTCNKLIGELDAHILFLPMEACAGERSTIIRSSMTCWAAGSWTR